MIHHGINVGVEGWVTVQLIHRSGVILRELKFKNQITNGGMDVFFSPPGIYSMGAYLNSASGSASFMAVGTGSTAPTAADTTLDTEITPSSSNRTSSDGGYTGGSAYVSGTPDYFRGWSTYLFGFSQGNGNLTEIGIFTAVTGGTMIMRQLLKDSGGIPTTIVKTSDEQLRVIYEVRLYPPTSDDTQSAVTISGVNYDITTRAANISQTGGLGWSANSSGIFVQMMNWATGNAGATAYETDVLAARTGVPSGTAIHDAGRTPDTYTPGNYYRDVTYEWGAAIANFATGIGSITHGMDRGNNTSARMFQTSFDPKFAKDNTKRLRLVVRYTLNRV